MRTITLPIAASAISQPVDWVCFTTVTRRLARSDALRTTSSAMGLEASCAELLGFVACCASGGVGSGLARITRMTRNKRARECEIW